ncbi:MAG: hypothetical protein SFV23_21770 [Planctomycetaceae bacterium]|nr:hypothetical protein [Planctomycetaceae bacterium]
MPAARIAFLAVFVVLFASAWSNDPGLRAAPLPPRVVKTAVPQPTDEAPSIEPAVPRPDVAEGGTRTSRASTSVRAPAGG